MGMSVDVIQLIKTVTAVDADEPQGGQNFSYSLAPEMANNPYFTLRDNQGTEKNLTRTSEQIPMIIVYQSSVIKKHRCTLLPSLASMGHYTQNY